MGHPRRQRHTGRRGIALIALVAAASLGLSACQTASPEAAPETQQTVDLPPLDTLTPTADPANYEGPTTVRFAQASIDPLPVASQVLPVTVQSHDGATQAEVTISDTSRIIALSLTGTVAELVYALGFGDNLVGRDISTNLPGTEDLPIVTRASHAIDAESVLSLGPTLVITDGTIGPRDVVLQLREAGIAVVTVDRAVSPDSTYTATRQIAAALGIAPSADVLIDGLKTAIAEKEAEIARLIPTDPTKLPRVTFLYVRGTKGVFYLFGEGSGIDSVFASLGVIDVAKEIDWVGERPLTDEALIAIDPDIIVVMSKGLESAGGVDGLIEGRASIAITTAGMNRRIIDADDTVLFAGGTRIPDVLDGLARAIYAPDSLR